MRLLFATIVIAGMAGCSSVPKSETPSAREPNSEAKPASSDAPDVTELKTGQTIRFLYPTTVGDLDSARRVPRASKATQYIDEDAFIQGLFHRKKEIVLEAGTVATIIKDGRCDIGSAGGVRDMTCAAIIQIGDRHFSLFNGTRGITSWDDLYAKVRTFSNVIIIKQGEHTTENSDDHSAPAEH